MKICVLVSSYDGSGSPFEKYDQYQDPSRYISEHDFHLRFITKKDMRQQLDAIKDENFDLLLNFLWGQHYDNVAGIDAVAYAESLGIPMIGTTSGFLSLSKIDFKLAAIRANILTPPYNVVTNIEDKITLTKFPLIVKSARGCGSLHMDKNSVCNTPKELEEQIDKLLNIAGCQILVEEYIFGRECSVIVIEHYDGTYALNPVVYQFPDEYTPTEQFLHFENKFDLVDMGVIKIKFMNEEDPLFNAVKEVACRSFNALHVYGSGYARVDMRIDNNGNIYLLEVNHTPAFFSALGNTFGDDDVILNYFEGGHTALFNQLIQTKLRYHNISYQYKKLSSSYDSIWEKSNFRNMLQPLFEKYNYSGQTLDLGCGTGAVGRLMTKYGHQSTLTGVDISPEMTEKATAYVKIHIGPMERIIHEIQDQKFDHIFAIGCLHFLNGHAFEEIFQRMCTLALKSITISVEEIPDEYNKWFAERGHETIRCYNNKITFDAIKLPTDWKVHHHAHDFLWESPANGMRIYGSIIRLERF